MQPLHALAFVTLSLATLPGGDVAPRSGRLAAPRLERVEVERTRVQMGTRLRVRVEAVDRATALLASEAVFTEVERIEALLSTWRDDSAISALNRAPVGEPVPLSPELLGLLAEAEGWAVATDRAFDPAVGALVDAWDLRGHGRVPHAPALAAALGGVGREAFSLDPDAGTATRHHPSAWIDTGSFGKGVALRAGAAVLVRLGVRRALLDFGGQVLVIGDRAAGEPEPVLVAHPVLRDRPSCRLLVRDASVSTSGASERFVVVGGERLGHVLDPRTGRPVPAWGSVTVVAHDPVEADALSTALFVLGPDEGLRRASARDGTAALFLAVRDGHLDARWTPAMERWLAHPAGPCEPEFDTFSKEDPR